jgi:hypothetical protein
MGPERRVDGDMKAVAYEDEMSADPSFLSYSYCTIDPTPSQWPETL